MIKRILPYTFWLYIIALLIGTVIPNWMTNQKVGIGFLCFRLDHWLHFFSYFGLCFLFILWNYSQLSDYKTNYPFKKSWWIIIFAAFTEISQIIIPGRSSNLKDFISNLLGIIFGLISCYILKSLLVWKLNKRPQLFKVGLEPSVVKIDEQTKV